jgi:hypothetical protein
MKCPVQLARDLGTVSILYGPHLAQELANFVAEIGRLFTPAEIRTYLRHLQRTKFLGPPIRQLRQTR